jgi:hypothetical protein
VPVRGSLGIRLSWPLRRLKHYSVEASGLGQEFEMIES